MEKTPTESSTTENQNTDQEFTRLSDGSVLPTAEEADEVNSLAEPSSRSQKFKKFMGKYGKTIGASAVATLTASSLATAEKNRENKQIDMSQPYSYEAVDPGFHDVVPGEGKIKLPGLAITWEDRMRKKEGPSEHIDIHNDIPYLDELEIPQTGSENILTDRTKEAQEALRETILNKMLDDIRKALNDGYTIDNIFVQGFNSDESRKKDSSYDGLNQDDPENELKAKQEAEIIEMILDREIGKQFEPSIAADLQSKTVVSGGEEIHDQAMNDKIEEIAKTMSISTADLVMQFNTNPNSLPKNVQEDLSVLRNDRFVRVSMTASKQSATSSETSKLRSIVLIPILIPLLKREKSGEPKKSTRPTHSPEPPVPPFRLPTAKSTPIQGPGGWISGRQSTIKSMAKKPVASATKQGQFVSSVGASTLKPTTMLGYNDSLNSKESRSQSEALKPVSSTIAQEQSIYSAMGPAQMPHTIKRPDGWIEPKPLPIEEPQKQNFGLSPNITEKDQFTRQVPNKIKQPRQHNFNTPTNTRSDNRGIKMDRSSGGDRRGKRKR